MENDLTTEFIDIDVPDSEADICAEQIGEQMGLMFQYMYAQVDALFRGDVLIPFSEN